MLSVTESQRLLHKNLPKVQCPSS